MYKLALLVKRILFLFFCIIIISFVTYVPDDEIKNTNITPGDRLIIDLFK